MVECESWLKTKKKELLIKKSHLGRQIHQREQLDNPSGKHLYSERFIIDDYPTIDPVRKLSITCMLIQTVGLVCTKLSRHLKCTYHRLMVIKPLCSFPSRMCPVQVPKLSHHTQLNNLHQLSDIITYNKDTLQQHSKKVPSSAKKQQQTELYAANPYKNE